MKQFCQSYLFIIPLFIVLFFQVQIGRQGKLYRRRVNSGGETVQQEIAKDVLVVVQPAKSALPKGSKTEDLVDEPWVGIVKFVKKTAGVVTSVHFCWLYPRKKPTN